MKTFVLTVSKTFPTTHKRKGEGTGFNEKILLGQGCPDCIQRYLPYKCNAVLYPNCFRNKIVAPKIHTIRANYDLWDKRIKQIQEGKAILSIRYWSGKPYNSKQVEICQLDSGSGIGVQKVILNFNRLISEVDGSVWNQNIDHIAKNDGLSLEDFKEWFKKYDLSKTMAIIHFTTFRYGNV